MGVFDFLEDKLEDAASDIGSRFLGDEAGGMLDSVFGEGSDSGGGEGDGGGGWAGKLGSLLGGGSDGDTGDSGGGGFGGFGDWSGALGGVIDRVAGEGAGEGLWSDVTSQLGKFLPDDVSGLADRALGGDGSWVGQLVDTASNYAPDGWGSVANAARGLGLGEEGIDALLERGAQALADGDVDLGRMAMGGLEPQDLLNQSAWSTAADQVAQRTSSWLGEGETLDGMSDVVPQVPGDDIVDPLFQGLTTAPAPGHDAVDDQPATPDDVPASDDFGTPSIGDDQGFGGDMADPEPEPEPMDDFSRDIADAEQVETELVDDFFEGLS